MHALAKLTLGLLLLAIVLIGALTGAARASQPSLAAELTALFEPPKGCVAPCWIGIQPGVTGSAAAERALYASGWVSETRVIESVVTSDRHVRWYWNSHQPGVIDGSRFGQMWIRRGVVYLIEVPLRVPHSAVWDAFGTPQQRVITAASLHPPRLTYVAVYRDGWLEFSLDLPCPLRGDQLLGAQTVARITNLRRDPAMFATRRTGGCAPPRY
jgi:hypothetical protein